MRTDHTKNNHRYYFDSITELSTYLEAHKEKALHYLTDDERSWFGETSADAMRKLKFGDEDLLERYVKTEGHLKVIHDDIEVVHDVTGAVVDVGAFLTGEPECMIDFLPQAKERFVDLNINIGFSAMTSEEEVFNKCIYIIKLIDLLESSGHRCKIILSLNNQGTDGYGHKKMLLQIDFKNHQEQLNLSSLLFCCCNPAFMRRCELAIHQIHIDEIGFKSAGASNGIPHIIKGMVNILDHFNDRYDYEGTDADFHAWAEKIMEENEVIIENR